MSTDVHPFCQVRMLWLLVRIRCQYANDRCEYYGEVRER